jgi:hypothetical protein
MRELGADSLKAPPATVISPYPSALRALSNGSAAMLLTRAARSRMPSRLTVLTFVVGKIAVTAVTWLILDFTPKMAMGLFLSMLLGGSLYFRWSARN